MVAVMEINEPDTFATLGIRRHVPTARVLGSPFRHPSELHIRGKNRQPQKGYF